MRLARRLWHSPVLVNSFAHLLRMLGGPISVFFIANRLSLESQGLYYSIMNLAVFQTLAEVGLTPLLITFASHEASHLQWDKSGLAQAPDRNLQRLSQLTRIALYYFLLAAPILALVLTGMGVTVFGKLEAAQRLAVVPVWAAALPAICLRFMLTGLWAILEGCGRMLWVYRVRTADTVLSLLVLWLGLHFGLGIYALPLSYWVSFSLQFGAMLWIRAPLRQLFYISPATVEWTIVREIWPLLWRVALATLAGMVSSQFSSLMLYFRTAAEAGQLGMTWSLLAGTSAICGILIAARNPQQCGLVARNDVVLARVFYRKTLLAVIVLASSIVTAGTVAVWAAGEFHSRWAARLLDPQSTALLGLGLAISWICMAQSSWVRAHKREPFLFVNLLNSCALLIGIVCLVPGRGAYGLALAFTGSLALFLFPGTTYFSERLVANPNGHTENDLSR